jgi:hypothetical protein
MSFEKWEQLRELAQRSAPAAPMPTAQTFPGGILAEIQDNLLRLTRTI